MNSISSGTHWHLMYHFLAAPVQGAMSPRARAVGVTISSPRVGRISSSSTSSSSGPANIDAVLASSRGDSSITDLTTASRFAGGMGVPPSRFHAQSEDACKTPRYPGKLVRSPTLGSCSVIENNKLFYSLPSRQRPRNQSHHTPRTSQRCESPRSLARVQIHLPADTKEV